MSAENMPKVPEVWKKLGAYLHQDYMLDYPDFWSGIEEFSADLSGNDKRELIEFLCLLVEADYPGGYLKKIWEQSGSQIMIARVKPKAFFQALLHHVGGDETRDEK